MWLSILRELLIDYRQRTCEDGNNRLVRSALALGADQLFVIIT
jgi:hypothetical protein